MSLKEKIISTYKSLEKPLSENTIIAKIKEQAIDIFDKKGFPTSKDEDWKYTSIKSLVDIDYSLTVPKNSVTIDEIDEYIINIDSYKVIIIDGILNKELSSIDTVYINSLQESLEAQENNILNYFSEIAPKEDSMVALNTISYTDGAYINIPSNTILDKPIQVLNITSNTEEDILIQTRNLIIVGSNVEATVIERHHSLTNNNVLTNSVTEISVGENSHYYHHKIQNDNNNASLVDNTFVAQERYSNAYVDTFSFGGNITRNNLHFLLNKENATANLNGISLLNKKQHVDNFTFVNHKVPNCDSHELYKGIYDDSSRGVFTGKILIKKDAQKTNGNQQNNNLVLSEKARISTKPQLEIYADDVKANHGCTIGQLDNEALFFMRSRGIPEKEAKALLMYAFASEALKNVKIEELKSLINNIISDKLNVNLDF